MNTRKPARIGPITYPKAFSHSKVDMRRYPVLKSSWEYTQHSWEYTQHVLGELNATLIKKLPPLPNQAAYTVAVAGSYGRVEASKETSDLDFMILTENELSEDDKQSVIDTVRECAENLGIKMPNPDGVFSQSVRYEHLVVETGSKRDTLDLLAQRMLILMEARPIYNAIVFNNAANFILDNYLSNVSLEPTKEAVFLLNDLIRYFRSICVHLEFGFW